jgi:nucleoside-diphosphate-sugar epimerase
MRVFVTGASGHIASAVIPQLLAAGHQPVGLARSEGAADVVRSRGADVQLGGLDDLDVLHEAARRSDGVIHLAFKHDFGDYEGAVAADLRAVQAIGEALEGSGKPFVVTSGTLLLAFADLGRMGTERDTVPSGPRVDAENAVIGFADRGVRTSAIRLPPIVHSPLDHHGFAHQLVDIARARGTSAYVDDGRQRWPSVHTLDAGGLYLLALERAPAGTRLHAVADEGIPTRTIAETIGQRLDLPVASVEPGDAAEVFGFLGTALQLDNPTSAAFTRDLFAWMPTHPGLLDDLNEDHYTAAVTR